MKFRNVLSIALIGMLLQGCSGSNEANVSSIKNDVPDSVEQALENNPWREPILDTYKRATTEWGKNTLSDGVITEQENKQGQDLMIECLKNKGVKAEYIEPQGILHTDSGQKAMDSTYDCSTEVDEGVLGIYYSMRKNPDNLDENTIIAECLIRNKYVPPSFKPEDILADKGSPYYDIIDSPKTMHCFSDPLDLGL